MKRAAIHFDAQNPTQPQPCCRDCTCRQFRSAIDCLAGYLRMDLQKLAVKLLGWVI